MTAASGSQMRQSGSVACQAHSVTPHTNPISQAMPYANSPPLPAPAYAVGLPDTSASRILPTPNSKHAIMTTVPLFCAESARRDTARRLAERYDLLQVRQRPDSGYWLELGPVRLELLTTGKQGAVYAEFAEGAARHRREQGGGRGQPVAGSPCRMSWMPQPVWGEMPLSSPPSAAASP
jgi:hypothetical protein